MTTIEKILFLLFLIVGIIVGSNKSVSNKSVENATHHLGLTFDDFVKAYATVADEYYGDHLDIKSFQSRAKGDKKSLYVSTGNYTAIKLDLYGKTEYLSEITVFGEPKGRHEEEILRRAGSVYIQSIMAVKSDFTLNDATNIINTLSRDLKHSSVSLKGFEFTANLFDGILMLSIKAAS